MARPKGKKQVNWKLRREEVEKMYLVDKLPTKEIANHFGVCYGAVVDAMHRLNIPLRDNRIKNMGRFNYKWSGGRYKESHGYFMVYIPDGDFFRSMANSRNMCKEHRLVMAQSLGRCLHSWEIVHHLNGIRDDNRRENLQIVTDDRHKQITILECEITRLKSRLAKYE